MTNPINPMNRATANSVNNNTPAGTQTNDTSADVTAKAGHSPEHSSGSEDTVSLSTRSQQVIELQQHLDSSTGIDRARVDAIRQQIAEGNYPLDAEKIAENMLRIEQSLIE